MFLVDLVIGALQMFFDDDDDYSKDTHKVCSITSRTQLYFTQQ